MSKETRTLRYDEDPGLEAHRFQGIAQPFPNHFHDNYVIGYVKAGLRRLFCKDREYIVKPGDIFLFNPNDNRGCTQSGGETLDYREITGERELRRFSQDVIANQDSVLRRIQKYLSKLRGIVYEHGKQKMRHHY